jgi:hypothetical protein
VVTFLKGCPRRRVLGGAEDALKAVPMIGTGAPASPEGERWQHLLAQDLSGRSVVLVFYT